jgi:hypothetical protein
MQHERLPADTGSPALAHTQGEARTVAVLYPEHLEAQCVRPAKLPERLDGILLGAKDAETLLQLMRLEILDP